MENPLKKDPMSPPSPHGVPQPKILGMEVNCTVCQRGTGHKFKQCHCDVTWEKFLIPPPADEVPRAPAVSPEMQRLQQPKGLDAEQIRQRIRDLE